MVQMVGDEMDWTWGRGSTSSSSTGPSGDFTNGGSGEFTAKRSSSINQRPAILTR